MRSILYGVPETLDLPPETNVERTHMYREKKATQKGPAIVAMTIKFTGETPHEVWTTVSKITSTADSVGPATPPRPRSGAVPGSAGSAAFEQAQPSPHVLVA